MKHRVVATDGFSLGGIDYLEKNAYEFGESTDMLLDAGWIVPADPEKSVTLEVDNISSSHDIESA